MIIVYTVAKKKWEGNKGKKGRKKKIINKQKNLYNGNK